MQTNFYRLVFILLFAAATAVAQTSEFTYQGKLNDNGSVANATYDMQFRLFDNANAGQGAQQGSTLTKSSVAVSAGIFNVGLDFGTAPFSAGAERYLEISIRPAGSTGGYTAMAPRQKLTSAPYAVKSLAAVTADTATSASQLAGTPAANYVQTNDSRLTDARQPLPGSGSYIQNTSTEQAASNFNISGTGAANILRAVSHLELGVPAPFLRTIPTESSTIFLGIASGTQTATGGFNTILGFRSGSGLTSGNFNTFVGADSGTGNTTGFNNVFIGSGVGRDNTTGSNNTVVNGYLGGTNLSYASAIGAGATVTTNNTIVIGRGTDKVTIPGALNISASGGGTGALCLNANTFTVGLCSSSLRYKTNVKDYQPGLDLVRRLRPVTFNWKDGNMLDMGLVAEEVEQVDPLLVTYNKGQIEGVKYDRVGVVLLNAVKEQQQQIEVQKKEIDALKSEIENLRQLIVCRTTMRPGLCKEEK